MGMTEIKTAGDLRGFLADVLIGIRQGTIGVEIVDIKHEAQRLQGDPRDRNLEKIKQRYWSDPEWRERKLAYCRAWREAKRGNHER